MFPHLLFSLSVLVTVDAMNDSQSREKSTGIQGQNHSRDGGQTHRKVTNNEEELDKMLTSSLMFCQKVKRLMSCVQIE